MLPDQDRYFRLDLKPERVVRGASSRLREDVHHWSPRKIFAQDALYTMQWAGVVNTDIEKFFFGKIDTDGLEAVEFFSDFDGTRFDHSAFNGLLGFISAQKLRTPKGLAQIAELTNETDKNLTLLLIQEVRNMYAAILTECVWQIASAHNCHTKLIISDHPVTVYNRKCSPASPHCKSARDPDIRMHASQTYFPLSIDKVLIFTNLSWVRNPYQDELGFRPNPNYFRDTIFNFTDIQVDRELTEREVLEINYVTKTRAYRYIAAAEREWLFPERALGTPYWNRLGDGLLFMPEPRLIHMGGEVFIGYTSGRTESFSEYGHRPWQPGYEDPKRAEKEARKLARFQAEWAILKGPKHTARASNFGSLGRSEVWTDSPEAMDHYAKVAARYRKTRSSRKKAGRR